MSEVTADKAAPSDSTKATPESFVNVDSRGVATVDPVKRAAHLEAEAQKKAAADRPAWLPDNFKTPEDFAASYKELQTKLGTKQETPKEPQVTPEAAKVAVEQAGLDMAALGREIAANGKLSDASVAALKAKGLDEATINQHVEGTKALASQYRATLAQAIGGEENLVELGAWAKVNLTDKQAAAFDAALGSGDAELASLAIRGVYSRYVEAEGSDPKLVSGEGDVSKGIEPFRDSAEVTAAMRDPRYQTSEAYRQDVAKRLGVSKLFNRR
jgi:hypothetical protein